MQKLNQYKIIATSTAFSCEIMATEKNVVSELKRIKKIYQLSATTKLTYTTDWRRRKRRIKKVRDYNGDKLSVRIFKLNNL